jgi:hypothetical protein
VIHPLFAPSYRVFMPEYLLTGIQTETLMRDLSPITTDIYGTPHGDRTHPQGGAPPATWITEDGLDATQATADGGPCCQYISPAFFSAVDADPTAYPSGLGGLTMSAVRRMVSTLRGAGVIRHARQLTLDAIAQQGNAAQFQGDGTAASPMTRDVTNYYTAHPALGMTPYDLPAEQFRLTIGHLDATYARVRATDPLTGASVPARIVSGDQNQIVVQLPVTDSPRMLTVTDQPPVRTHRSRRGHEASVAGHCTACSDLVRAGIDWRGR